MSPVCETMAIVGALDVQVTARPLRTSWAESRAVAIDWMSEAPTTAPSADTTPTPTRANPTAATGLPVVNGVVTEDASVAPATSAMVDATTSWYCGCSTAGSRR